MDLEKVGGQRVLRGGKVVFRVNAQEVGAPALGHDQGAVPYTRGREGTRRHHRTEDGIVRDMFALRHLRLHCLAVKERKSAGSQRKGCSDA